MAFNENDTIQKQKLIGRKRASADLVFLSFANLGNGKKIQARVTIGSGVVVKMGWKKGNKVNIIFGSDADAGKLMLVRTSSEDTNGYKLGGGNGRVYVTWSADAATLQKLNKHNKKKSEVPYQQLGSERLVVIFDDVSAD